VESYYVGRKSGEQKRNEGKTRVSPRTLVDRFAAWRVGVGGGGKERIKGPEGKGDDRATIKGFTKKSHDVDVKKTEGIEILLKLAGQGKTAGNQEKKNRNERPPKLHHSSRGFQQNWCG